jgi:hypothetical protein
MGLDYGWEKFFSSLHHAVGSAAPLQELLEGVMSGVRHLRRDSFPDDETWKRFEKLLNETTYLSATGNEGAIRATMSQMTDDEAGRCLREAFEIFSKIAEAYGAQAQHKRPEGRSSGEVQ